MKFALGMMAIVACTVVANVLIKHGAVSEDSPKFVLGILGWPGLAGLCFYAVGALVYAWILKWVPLHLAQVIVATQFIGVILAAWWVFSEQINPVQWGGIVLIAAGILITGWSFDRA
jgi:drug/metabolite transporter (DMT)-like permease